MDHNAFLKTSLMSATIHKARMEPEGAQLQGVFKELDDGDLQGDGVVEMERSGRIGEKCRR